LLSRLREIQSEPGPILSRRAVRLIVHVEVDVGARFDQLTGVALVFLVAASRARTTAASGFLRCSIRRWRARPRSLYRLFRLVSIGCGGSVSTSNVGTDSLFDSGSSTSSRRQI